MYFFLVFLHAVLYDDPNNDSRAKGIIVWNHRPNRGGLLNDLNPARRPFQRETL